MGFAVNFIVYNFVCVFLRFSTGALFFRYISVIYLFDVSTKTLYLVNIK